MRRALVVSLCVLVAAACGGRQAVYEVPPGVLAEGAGWTLPPAAPAFPAFVLTRARPFGESALRALEKTPGVAVAAPVGLRRLSVRGPRRKAPLTVGAVNPLQFRSVAPPATRDADFVWLSLLAGRAVVSFDAVRRLGLRRAGTVTMTGTGRIAVGAFAENGSPDNVADILVSADDAAVPGHVRTVVIGAKTGTVLQRLGRALLRRVPGARVRRLSRAVRAEPQRRSGAPPAPAPSPVGQAQGAAIGTMSFAILKNGFIRPDPAWIRSNIAEGTVPILGNVTCHRIMFPQLRAALTEIEQRDLAETVRPGDYGGCFVPRFIDRDPSKPLSMHAFGLAVDLNVSTNGLGTRGDIDPRVVAIFEKWGFEWGGRWARPDPMHFELDRLLTG